jgi:hypothetical protein
MNFQAANFKNIVIILIMVAISDYSFAQQGSFNYQKPWQTIDSLLQAQLPESALKLVDAIHMDAIADKNQIQQIRAFIFSQQYQLNKEEALTANPMERWKSEYFGLDAANKAVLYAYQASFLSEIFRRERGKIYGRSKGAADPSDIATWDATYFNAKIDTLILKSLENADQLAAIPSINYKEFTNGSEQAWDYRPTLLDLLVWKALDFYQNDGFDVNPMPLSWIMNKSAFYNNQVENGGKVLGIFDLLAKSHRSDANKTAQLYVRLERLKYIYQHSQLPNKELLYREALESLKLDAGTHPFIANIIEEEANLIYQLVAQYIPEDPKTVKYRLYLADAVKVYQSVIDDFPQSDAAVRCTNKLIQIRQPNIQINLEKITRKGKPFFSRVNYTNFDRLKARIYKINSSEYLRKTITYGQMDRKKFSSARLVRESQFNLKPSIDYRAHSTETAFEALPPGQYIMEMIGNNSIDTCKAVAEFSVSGLTFSEEAGSFTVMDIENGKPLQGANILTWARNSIKSPKSVQTNSGGKGFVPNNSEMIQISLNGDTLIMPWYINHYVKPKDEPTQNLYLFTDRSVYRPGQKVFFKGILLNSLKDKTNSVANQHVQIIFNSSNNKSIDTLQLITNQYGSVSGSFTIPTSGMPGEYYLQSAFGNESIRVESYRRPGFEITTKPLEGEVRIGSEVKLTGEVKSFSGVSLKEVRGKYHITRSSFIWRWRSNPEEIESGTFTTDEAGKFSISFVAKADSLQQYDTSWPTQFNVGIDVTDISGETQTASKSFSMEKSALKAELIAPDFIDLSKDQTGYFSVGYSIVNADKQPINQSGKIELIRLKLPEERLLNRSWEVPDSPIYTEKEWYKRFPEVNYGKAIQPVDYKDEKIVSAQLFENAAIDSVKFDDSGLTSGYYKVKLILTDKFGEPVKAEKVIRVMDTKQKSFAFTDLFWTSLSRKTARPGDKVTLTFGGAGNHQWNVKVMQNDSVISTFNPVINQAVEQIILPVGLTDQGGFSISVSSVFKGKHYFRNYSIAVPFIDKTLKVEVVEFPKTAEPGKSVGWKVKITDAKGNPVKAELAGVVYDASLDKILPHNWHLKLWRRNEQYRQLNFPTIISSGYGNCYQYQWLQEKTINLPEIKDLYESGGNRMVFSTMESSSNIQIRGTKSASMKSMAGYDDGEVQDVEVTTLSNAEITPPESEKIEIRSDFRETAWFVAHLETDDKGEAAINFTLPESVTQWKFMALAHTQKGASGAISDVFTAKKKLMIEPFSTRFLKVGDTVHLPVKVTNLSGSEQNVRVDMTIMESNSGKKIDSLSYQSTIALADNKSEAVDWKFAAPAKPGMYKIRITAQGNEVSDGYETELPVEPASLWVNESQAYTIKPNSSYQYELKNLGSVAKTVDEKWDINLFANPLGLVLDALPQLLESETHTSTGNLLRLRGATTLRKIFADYPEVSQWIAAQRQKLLSSPDSFKTALERAEKFTQLKLDQTPWLSESEFQKGKLRKFNPDSIKIVIAEAIDKLENAQLPDGGFSWCPGMNSSPWMTTQLLENISEMRTDQLLTKVENDRINIISEKAFHFLDNSIKSEFRKLTNKEKENYLPASEIIDWLYARNAFPEIAVSEEMKVIADFYFGKAIANRTKLEMWQQLQLAFVMKSKVEEKIVQNMLLSFTERAIKNTETGMFWKRSQGYYFYQEPDIAFQSRMIQFYGEMKAPQETIDALKTWLLQQKRTHAWSSAFATAKAVSVMLSGTKQPISGIVSPKILLDGKMLSLPKITDPSGHIDVSINPSEIRPDSKLEIKNEGNSLLFGGLFHGYFKEDSDLSRTGRPLKIRKELFSVERTAKGDSLLTDFSKCRPGDLVKVRLLIETDRDLGYVSISDQRPAGTEPINTLSQYEYNSGLWYYRVNSDDDTKFFINDLSTGRYILEYVVRVSHQGIFSGGRATIQCSFAPEFGANHAVGKIRIGEK